MAEVTFKHGLQDFSVKLYGIYAEGSGNVFLSPYSIAAALLLADLGADKDTEKQIRDALGAVSVSKTDIHRQYKQLESALNAQTQGTTRLSIANRIFSKLGQVIHDTYKENAKQYYDTVTELLDFTGESEKSRQHINKWVEEQTMGKIHDLLPNGSIKPDSLMVLVNAIYFKGKWMKPSKSYSTRKEAFHMTKQKKSFVDMMNGKEWVSYVIDKRAGYSAVELPYKDSDIAMVFILPTEIEGLRTIEKQLDKKFMTNLFKALKSSGKLDVILKIPKFKMETGYQLENDLPRLGIVDMFDAKTADFSAMLPSTPEGAFISSAIHKAFIEVDEEGTEAAAATAMMVMAGCAFKPERPKEFIADHPFIFLIRDRLSDTILFLGRYVTPPS